MIRTDICHDEYHAMDRVSSGALKHFVVPSEPGLTPAHYIYQLANPKEPTPALWDGQHIHCRVLEPDIWEAKVRELPVCDRRTKAGKQIWAEALDDLPEGGVLLKREEIDRYDAIRDAVMLHPDAGPLIEGAETEVTLLWERDGYPCKARLDALQRDRGIVVDLKSCVSAHPDEVARSMAKYKYTMQQAWYTGGCYAVGLDNVRFLFVFVEKTPPYLVSVYELDDVSRMFGEYQEHNAFARYVECKVNGVWPGYPDGINEISLPAWSMPELTLDGEEVSL